MPNRTERPLPVPTKLLLVTSPDTTMLFAPFRCTHPPPPILPFLLKQNLSPKDIVGSDILKLKVSWRIYLLWALKSLVWNGKDQRKLRQEVLEYNYMFVASISFWKVHDINPYNLKNYAELIRGEEEACWHVLRTIAHWGQEAQLLTTSIPCHHQCWTRDVYSRSPEKCPAIGPLWFSSKSLCCISCGTTQRLWSPCLESKKYNTPFTMANDGAWAAILLALCSQSGSCPVDRNVMISRTSGSFLYSHLNTPLADKWNDT